MKIKQPSKKKPFQPNEELLIQRTWPNKTFDYEAYKHGINIAFNQNHLQKTSSGNWQLEGPGNIGGRFNCIAVHPSTPSIMYAGSANGGVWKTNDNGATWLPITDNLPYQAVGAITINPFNPNEIWVGFGDININGTMYIGDGLYKSSNGGVNWTHVGLSNTFVVSGIFFKSNTEMIVSTMGNPFAKDLNRGIYKSTNGGISFSQTLFVNDSTGIIDVVQHPTNRSILYASSYSRQRTDAQSMYQSDQNFIYKSLDFGQTWTKLSGGLPNGQVVERIGLSICKSNPDIVYALYGKSDYTNPLLYKSINAGANWTPIVFNNFSVGDYGNFGWYFGKIYTDPIDPNTLYMPSIVLLYSKDGGLNWLPMWGEFHADGHFMHFMSSNEFIYCTDGGIYKTNDKGLTWTDIENIPVNQFYYVTENQNNPGDYAGGVQDNGTVLGNASVLNNFQKINGADGFKIEFTSNPALVYSESQNGSIEFTDSYPNLIWQGIYVSNQNYNWFTPYVVSKSNENNILVGGQNIIKIDRLNNGTFTAISPNLHDATSPIRVSNISSLGQSTFDENKIYAGTADGNIWVTLNYGANWTEITPFTGSSFYVTDVKPSPNQPNTVYACRSGYRFNDNTPYIFKSVNNGTTWINITGNLPPIAVNDIEIMLGNENILFVATDAGVYYSLDAGLQWSRLGTNLPFVATLDVNFNYNHSKLIAGTFGRGLYTFDLTTLAHIFEDKVLPSNIELSPNPFQSKITIKTSQEFKNCSFEIYDENAALQLKSKLEFINNFATINLEMLNNGLYFIQFKHNDIVIHTQKIVKTE